MAALRTNDSWTTLKRVYWIGLAALVLSKNPRGPVLDAPPILASIENATGLHIGATSQIISLQVLAALALALTGGFFYRKASAAIIATLLYALHIMSLYSLIYTREFDYLPHAENIHAFTLAILALQTWIPRTFTAKEARLLILGLFGWTYLAAAMTKIRLVGISWASSETLPSWFALFWMYSDNPLSLWFAQNPALANLAGWATLVFEFAFLPLMFVRGAFVFLISAAVILHTMVWLTHGINFLPSYALLSIFLLRELPRTPKRSLENLKRIIGRSRKADGDPGLQSQ
jgi:hypothetical protein